MEGCLSPSTPSTLIGKESRNLFSIGLDAIEGIVPLSSLGYYAKETKFECRVCCAGA
jgi:hypothetical protein